MPDLAVGLCWNVPRRREHRGGRLGIDNSTQLRSVTFYNSLSSVGDIFSTVVLTRPHRYPTMQRGFPFWFALR